jgi:hypothetical protein
MEKAFENLHLTWEAGRNGIDWTISLQDDPAIRISPDNILAVYWRRVVLQQDSPMLGLATSANFDRYELFWSLRWLLESLPAHFFPLGHPDQMIRGQNKHLQVEAALRVGFEIPESFHSNDPVALDRFIAGRSEVAIKGLRMPGVTRTGKQHEARHISCREFPSRFLRDKISAIDRTQLHCQEAIHRACDLRIMVLPNEIIAVEIDTSSLAGNQLDWREDCLKLRHRIVPIGQAFQRQLREFLVHMNLETGHFDFALRKQSPPVFFECNPNAQWRWIEMITGHPISDAIARELASPKTQ